MTPESARPPLVQPTWHARSTAQTAEAVSVTIGAGLGAAEAARRLQQHGQNRLPAARRRPAWLRLALQFHNPLIYVLLVADLRLVRTKNLCIDEAALTGESVAAEKRSETVAEDAPIGDRSCMAYSGTVVSVGQARGIVVATGTATGVILLAVFAGLTLPVTAGQVLWVNMVTAVTLALALAFEPAEADVMRRPPRPPAEPLVTRMLALRIAYVSLLMVGATFAAFQWELARGSSLELARTTAVNMLAACEVAYLFTARHFTASALTLDIFRGNRMILWMSALLVALQLAFTYAPPLQRLFQTTGLGWSSWLMVLGLALCLLLAVEAGKAVLRHRGVAGV